MTNSLVPLPSRCDGRRIGYAAALWSALVSCSALAADAQHAAVIAALQARIEALEQRLADLERGRMPADAATPVGASVPVSGPAPIAAAGVAPPVRADDEMARALERALVREGGLLLPPAAFEIEPRWSYQYGASGGLELFSVNGATQLARIERRRDWQQAAIGVRVGLPAQWQLDLLLPYLSLQQRQSVAGGALSGETSSGFGAGEMGVSWQLRPLSAGTGVVAALRRSEPASSVFERSNALAPASGFAAWQDSVLFVTRRDPVVFIGALSHAWRQSRRLGDQTIEPGDVTGLRAGAIVALSPEISLRLGLELARARSTRIDGLAVGGTNAVSGELSTGFSLALSPRVLLGIEAGIGLTPASD